MWLQSIEMAEANVNRRRDAVAVESAEDFMITVGTRARREGNCELLGCVIDQ